MTLYSVPFTITGRIEVEAEDEEDALEQAAEYGLRQLVDDGLDLSVDIDTAELED